MPTNPFYRFETAAYNAGFEPAFTPTVDALNGFLVDIPNGFGVGLSLTTALSQIQGFIAQRNVAKNDFGFRLIYPSYIAPLVDIQTVIFYISNDQLKARNPDQVYQISFDLDDQLITATTVIANPDISKVANYSDPLYQPEQVAYNALEIANQNGTAFFPLVYNYDSTTGIAKSGLSRCKNCQFDTALGFPARVIPNSYPFSPDWSIKMEALNAEEKWIVKILDSVINAGFDSTLDQSDLLDKFYNLIAFGGLPDGWSYITPSSSALYDRINISIVKSSGGKGFSLVGRKDSSWLFQRFYTPNTEDFLNLITSIFPPTTPLPYPSIDGKSYGYNWFDFEQVVFAEDCPIDPEFYQMPVKTSDLLQFNAIPNVDNLFGLNSASVGIFDSNDVFLLKIGETKKDVIPNTLVYTFDFPSEFTYPCDSLTRAGLFQDVINWDSRLPSYIQVCNTSGGVVLNWLSNFVADLTIGSASYITIVGGYRLTWTIENWAEDFIPLASIGYTTTFGPITTWHNCYEGSSCYNIPTQLNTTVTIPYLADGCYRFGYYNFNPETGQDEIYSLSQPISIQNWDCFSTIIEFWGQSDSIAEGFEYIDNWRQRIRIGLNGGGEKPQIEENIYRQSNGIFRRPQNKQDLTLDLHTDFLDVPTQLAIVGATRHKYLIWNGKNVFVTGDIEIATTQDFTSQSSFENLSQMKFSVLVQGFQPKNSSCIGC
jgi:hypothetical protein